MSLGESAPEYQIAAATVALAAALSRQQRIDLLPSLAGACADMAYHVGDGIKPGSATHSTVKVWNAIYDIVGSLNTASTAGTDTGDDV